MGLRSRGSMNENGRNLVSAYANLSNSSGCFQARAAQLLTWSHRDLTTNYVQVLKQMLLHSLRAIHYYQWEWALRTLAIPNRTVAASGISGLSKDSRDLCNFHKPVGSQWSSYRSNSAVAICEPLEVTALCVNCRAKVRCSVVKLTGLKCPGLFCLSCSTSNLSIQVLRHRITGWLWDKNFMIN